MSYLRDTLGDGETVIYVASFHWLYTANAILWLALFGVAGVAVAVLYSLYGLSLSVVGVLSFFYFMIRKWTTEIAVTDRRFVYKRGWIFRNTEEISVHRIEEVNLRQGVVGRILGYGQLRVAGTGVGSITLPDIDEPIAFRRALQTAQGQAVKPDPGR